jgi:hypothetical protein
MMDVIAHMFESAIWCDMKADGRGCGGVLASIDDGWGNDGWRE